jgi:hypothetical protein
MAQLGRRKHLRRPRRTPGHAELGGGLGSRQCRLFAQGDEFVVHQGLELFAFDVPAAEADLFQRLVLGLGQDPFHHPQGLVGDRQQQPVPGFERIAHVVGTSRRLRDRLGLRGRLRLLPFWFRGLRLSFRLGFRVRLGATPRPPRANAGAGTVPAPRRAGSQEPPPPPASRPDSGVRVRLRLDSGSISGAISGAGPLPVRDVSSGSSGASSGSGSRQLLRLGTSPVGADLLRRFRDG